MKQVSRTAATKIDIDELDPLSAFAQEAPAVPTSKGAMGNLDGGVGGFQIRDDADLRDTSEFVTVEKLKIVGSTKKESITPSPSSSSLSISDSPKKMRLGSVSPMRGGASDRHAVDSPADNFIARPVVQKKTNGDASPIPASSPLTGNESLEDLDNFPFLSGEMKVMAMTHAAVHVIPIGGISGVLYMTNYRIVFLPSENDLKTLRRTSPSFLSWLDVPLASIDKIEREKRPKETPNAGITMMIYCKECRQLRINIKPQSSSNGDYDLERAFSLMNTYAFPNNLRYLFAFNHNIGRFNIGTLYHEYMRMGIGNSPLWRVSHVNQDFRLCSTYPEELVVPSSITDDELHIIGAFRSGHRLPVLCWASTRHSASVWRSSQPKAGVSGSCLQDIRLLDVIARTTGNQRQKDNAAHGRPSAVNDSFLYIVDARSRNSAMANMAAGAGYETQNYYSSCRLDFYNIPNIHAVRDSYKSMLSLVLNPTANPSSDLTFSKQVEDTSWLTNVRLILKASFETAAFVNKGYPVLVHCSHGWDRTAQITSLAQLFLDPFYRTFDGFPVLIEKEWLAYGHQFQMRCAHGQDKGQRQDQEFSPIFIQFLDCLWQVLRRFGQYFEFNTKYVLTIADHVYSGRFGTFLFSSEHDRRTHQARTNCADLWQYLASNRAILSNPYYHSVNGVFLPPLGQLLRGVTLWADYFLRWSSVVSIPSVSGELATYPHQLRQLEKDNRGVENSSKDNSKESDVVVLPNEHDAKLHEIVAVGDYEEALCARERFHRLTVEKELRLAGQRHQRALETLLAFVHQRVTGDVIADLEAEIHRLEDEEILQVQQSLLANIQRSGMSSTNSAGRQTAANNLNNNHTNSNNNNSQLNSNHKSSDMLSSSNTDDDVGNGSDDRCDVNDDFQSLDEVDSSSININVRQSSRLSDSTDLDASVTGGHLQLPENLSSAECIEVLQTAAEVQAEATAEKDLYRHGESSALPSPISPPDSSALLNGGASSALNNEYYV